MFHLRTPQGNVFDAFDCEVDCSITRFGASDAGQKANFPCDIVRDERGILSVVRVRPKPADTINLWGKFIYQITLKRPRDDRVSGWIDIPMQGLLFIGQNVNAEFISEHI